MAVSRHAGQPERGKKMNPYDMFEAKKDHAILDYGDFQITIKRAGSSNAEYTKLLAALLKPHRYKIQNGVADPKVIREVMAEVYAKTVIVGWENVTDRAGKKIAFNVENCKKLLIDLEALFDDIQEQAEKLSNFRKEQNEEDAKNSQES